MRPPLTYRVKPLSTVYGSLVKSSGVCQIHLVLLPYLRKIRFAILTTDIAFLGSFGKICAYTLYALKINFD